MQPFTFAGDEPLRVLALGCHSDDVEIGCGGTLLELVRRAAGVDVTWAVLSAEGERRAEAEKSARAFTEGATQLDLRLESFRDGYFPYDGARVKDWFEDLKTTVDPDVVFTHHGSDRHQDHRLVAELTWNTFRRHLILEYEVPKFDGDLGSPNVFFALGEDAVETKMRLLGHHFGSQTERHWFDEEVFRGLLRLRGIEAAPPTRYAEAFYARKLSLSA
jgi:LmbE family N-acetylglucosaminyl deacetylase